MVLRLFSREETFFVLFNRAAENILQGGQMLQDFFDDYRDTDRRAEAIKAVEERGDEITHDVIDRLNRTFVTPFDRDDIYDLAKQLDNVLDWIEAAAARMVVYRIPRPTREAQEMAHVILHTCKAIVEAVGDLCARPPRRAGPGDPPPGESRRPPAARRGRGPLRRPQRPGRCDQVEGRLRHARGGHRPSGGRRERPREHPHEEPIKASPAARPRGVEIAAPRGC